MAHNCFEVRIGDRVINKVFFDVDMKCREVRRRLIDHDHYSENISVFLWDGHLRLLDCARASHKMEC